MRSHLGPVDQVIAVRIYNGGNLEEKENGQTGSGLNPAIICVSGENKAASDKCGGTCRTVVMPSQWIRDTI